MKTDNGDIEKKIELRKHFLEKQDRVLDMCCGAGVMFKECYKGLPYVGIDLKGGSFTENVFKGDSIEYIKRHGMDATFIDIDPYGYCYAFYIAVLQATKESRLKIVCTDGGLSGFVKKGPPEEMKEYRQRSYKKTLEAFIKGEAKKRGYEAYSYICFEGRKMLYCGLELRRE